MWRIEEKTRESYFEIHFYFDSVKNYGNNRSVDMYIGNHFFFFFGNAERSSPAYKKTKKLLAGAARCFSRNHFFFCGAVPRELSFLWRKFRCKIIRCRYGRTFVRSFVRWILAWAFRRPRAFPRGGTFSYGRGETFSTSRANRNPFDLIVDLTRTWPHVTAFRSIFFLEIIEGRCEYLAESAVPDFFSVQKRRFLGFFGGKTRVEGKNWTRNRWKIHVFTDTKESAWLPTSTSNGIAQSRDSRSQLYYENVIDEINYSVSRRSEQQRIMTRWNDNGPSYIHIYTFCGYIILIIIVVIITFTPALALSRPLLGYTISRVRT